MPKARISPDITASARPMEYRPVPDDLRAAHAASARAEVESKGYAVSAPG